MTDCDTCGMPYTSPLAAAECADQDAAEEAGSRRMARHHTRRLRSRAVVLESWGDDD